MTTKNSRGTIPRNSPIYGLIVAFETTRETVVAGGHNGGINFGNVVSESEDTGTGNTGGGGDGAGRKREFWHCGGDHLKRNGPKLSKKGKEKNQKEKGGEWCIRKASDKCADGKTKVKRGQLYTMFTSLVYSTSGAEFSKLGEGDKFTWHQLHVKDWGAQDF